MDSGDGAPEVREPVIWVLMRLGVSIPRSLSTSRLSSHGNYWLGARARVKGLLVVPHPSQKVHDKGPHEGLTKDGMRVSCHLNFSFSKASDFRILIENKLSNYTDFLFRTLVSLDFFVSYPILNYKFRARR